MPETLVIPNYTQINILAETTLEADVAAGSSSVIAENASEILPTGVVVIGEGEQAEILLLSNVVGQTLNFLLSTTKFDHQAGERILNLVGSQILLYRSPWVTTTYPDPLTYTLVGTFTPIAADQQQTYVIDQNGGSGFWYVYAFKNPTTGDMTDITDMIPVRGGNVGHLTTTAAIRIEAGLGANRYIDESVIMEALEDAEGEVKSSVAIGGYILPFANGRIPFMVRKAVKLLAAGYLLMSYSESGLEGVYAQGSDKIKQAKDIMGRIENDTSYLLDSNDVPSDANANAGEVGGFPFGSDFDSCDPNEPWFTRRSKF